MSEDKLHVFPLGPTWETQDPFLFCAYHLDHYPKGNQVMGPDASLEGRNLGSDFGVENDWRMYHGKTVPGFPYHPHRGFETVTLANVGYCDHSDSLGAAGRFGNGDVQWMTAGIGVQHSEMFPLIHQDRDNPLELLQLWLNLPRSKKFVQPHFKMMWAEDIPEWTVDGCRVKLIAGDYGGRSALPPNPDSWAADPENRLRILMVSLEPEARFEIDRMEKEINRTLYFFEGDELRVGGHAIRGHHGIHLAADRSWLLENTAKTSRVLILEGRPIGEPVAKYGPFVMNTQEEIREAMRDYGKTQFGGWPWPKAELAHDRNKGRFALYPDGTYEERELT